MHCLPCEVQWDENYEGEKECWNCGATGLFGDHPRYKPKNESTRNVYNAETGDYTHEASGPLIVISETPLWPD